MEFVEMSDDEAALHAINAINGTDVEGRTLTVSEARPKADRARDDRRKGGRGFGRKRS